MARLLLVACPCTTSAQKGASTISDEKHTVPVEASRLGQRAPRRLEKELRRSLVLTPDSRDVVAVSKVGGNQDAAA